MVDRQQPILPGWVAFDHKVPVVGVDPDDLSSSWTVCFNSAWLPYILGAIAGLSRVEVWDTDDFSARNTEALRGEHLLALFMEQCELPPQTLVSGSDDGCGFKVSYDNGDTWVQFGMVGCITDLVGSGIETAILNGVIAQPGEVPTDTTPPAVESCKTYHATLSAASTWLLPVKLSVGDTIEVTNARGAWSDMKTDVEFPFDWNCANGGVYLLGSCLPPQVPKESDPFQDANHMELVLQFADDHALPMRGLITIPGGVFGIDGMFVPNYDRTPLGSGTVEFDVEVCKSAALEGCFMFDFTDDGSTFEVSHFPDAPTVVGGEYVAGEGWQSTFSIDNQYLTIITTDALGSFTWDSAYIDFYNPHEGSIDAWIDIWNDDGQLLNVYHAAVLPGESTYDLSWSSEWPSTKKLWLNIAFRDNQAMVRRIRFLGCTGQPANTTACV